MRIKNFFSVGEYDPEGIQKTLQYIFNEAMGRVSTQDQEFKDAEDGVILTDRETGDKYRVKVVNGNIELEDAEGY